MAFVVAFVAQKGGTAKTTMAVNLGVAGTRAGLEVLIIDLDPQVSACEWRDLRRDFEEPLVISCPVPHIERHLKTAEKMDLVIIDTAGRTNDAAVAAARHADLVIVPVQPSVVDLKTIGATLDVIRLGGSKQARALLTRVRPFGSRAEDTVAWLADQGLEALPVMIGERVTYQDSFALGKGVLEMDPPDGKAAAEVDQLYRAVMKLQPKGSKA